jgi:hypothetical protein
MYFRICLIALSVLVRVIAIPVPASEGDPNSGHESPRPFAVQTYGEGDIVGVRPGEYEHGASKDVDIHPGVVLDGPRDNGKYGIAMISKKLPHDPPQQDVKAFHPETTLYGNVALGPEKEARPVGMKPWKSDKTGVTEVPMPHAGVEALKVAMEPHTGWSPPPPNVPPSSPHPGFEALHPGHTPTIPVDNPRILVAKPKKKKQPKAQAGSSTQPTDHSASSTHNPNLHAPQAQRKARRPAVNHQLSSGRNHSPSRAHASAHAVRGRHPYHTGSRSRSKSPVGRNQPRRGRSRSPRRSPPHHP